MDLSSATLYCFLFPPWCVAPSTLVDPVLLVLAPRVLDLTPSVRNGGGYVPLRLWLLGFG